VLFSLWLTHIILAVIIFIRIIIPVFRGCNVRLRNGEIEPLSPKRRGPKPRVRPSDLLGRAENFRGNLIQVWDRLWPLLSKAESADNVTKAFQEGASPHDQNFVPGLSQLLIGVLKETTFPQRPKSMQRFIADSAAALGDVTARRSRDICMQERMKAKRANHIIRHEYYIECSCGYEGPARDRACRKCGATISPSLYR